VAVDGRMMNQDEFLRMLDARKPGETLKLAVMRRGALQEISVITVPYPYAVFKLRLVENPTEMQRKIYESWVRGK
jgi:hypothetical protein